MCSAASSSTGRGSRAGLHTDVQARQKRRPAPSRDTRKPQRLATPQAHTRPIFFHVPSRNIPPSRYTAAMTTAASGEPQHAASAAPATIAQIAELAGVSVPTVSKVVNGRAQVAPETRARVEAVIRSHGFQRRKRLSAAPSVHVELVFHELEGAYAMEAIRGAER